jgi:hypothetical protein
MNGIGRHSDVLNAKPESDESKRRLIDELKRRGNLAFKAVRSSSEKNKITCRHAHMNTEIDGGSSNVVFQGDRA